MTWRVPPSTLPLPLLGRAAALACCGLLLGCLAWTPVARAQAWVPGKGQGSIALVFQQSQTNKGTDSRGNAVNLGKVIGSTLSLSLDYGLSERWAISANLPLKRNRYIGNDPHYLPANFPIANDQRFIDDGQYHAGWADWSVALRYQWRTEPFLVTPFIAYARPSHDYTFFGHSGFGTQQWAVQAGVHIGNWFAPPRQNLYWQAGYAYTYEQPVSHRRVNHDVLSLELGYFPTPRLNTHLSIEHSKSYGDGIHSLDEFSNADGSPNFENILYHDQLFLARYTKVTVGMDFQLNARLQLSVRYGRTLKAALAHEYEDVSIGLSRSF